MHLFNSGGNTTKQTFTQSQYYGGNPMDEYSDMQQS